MTEDETTVYINQENIGNMVISPNLKDADYTVFILLMGLMDATNKVRMTQAQLAARMKRSRKYISASVGRLRAEGCIRTTRYGVIVSPELAWKGTLTDREDLILEALEHAFESWDHTEAPQIAL